jgi:hypothetical protein
MTHTFVVLEVSRELFDFVHGKLKEAGNEHAFISERGGDIELIDMHGIALQALPDLAVEKPAPTVQAEALNWDKVDSDLHHIIYREVGGDIATRMIFKLKALLRQVHGHGS